MMFVNVVDDFADLIKPQEQQQQPTTSGFTFGNRMFCLYFCALLKQWQYYPRTGVCLQILFGPSHINSCEFPRPKHFVNM